MNVNIFLVTWAILMHEKPCLIPTINFSCFFVSVLGVGLWKLILCISAPLSFIKTGISVIHLYVAMQNVAAIDAAEREQMKEKAS